MKWESNLIVSPVVNDIPAGQFGLKCAHNQSGSESVVGYTENHWKKYWKIIKLHQTTTLQKW